MKKTIDQAVNKFLCWKLPKDFGPDCGISFDGRKDDEGNKNKTWPIGTNLLTADQARAMFEHCLSGIEVGVAQQVSVPLSEDQINKIVREAAKGSAIRRDGSTAHRIARAVEAHHKIKPPQGDKP